jgi:hypothetical protein
MQGDGGAIPPIPEGMDFLAEFMVKPYGEWFKFEKKQRKRLRKRARQAARRYSPAGRRGDGMCSRTLEDAAQALGYPSYRDYLASGHWADFQARVYAAYGSVTCVACDFPRPSLHHVTYERLGRESLSDVIPLCSRCHRAVHRYHYTHNVSLERIGSALVALFRWGDDEARRRLGRYRELLARDRRALMPSGE